MIYHPPPTGSMRNHPFFKKTVSNVTKSNPVRTRSKICLLEYSKLRKMEKVIKNSSYSRKLELLGDRKKVLGKG